MSTFLLKSSSLVQSLMMDAMEDMPLVPSTSCTKMRSQTRPALSIKLEVTTMESNALPLTFARTAILNSHASSQILTMFTRLLNLERSKVKRL